MLMLWMLRNCGVRVCVCYGVGAMKSVILFIMDVKQNHTLHRLIINFVRNLFLYYSR